MQVPADRVIALLTQELGDMHRENAILKVQVEILTAEQNSTPQVVVPALPPVPSLPLPATDSTPLYSALTDSQPEVSDTTPAPDLSAA